MSELFRRWYPNELTARNGAVLTTRYIAETHYDALFDVSCGWQSDYALAKDRIRALEEENGALRTRCRHVP